MLADFLPSSCFLHSGEIIRNDFILTAQMNTKWNLGYYYCRLRAGYGNLNRGSDKLQRDLSLKITAGAHFQLASIENLRQLLFACCLGDMVFFIILLYKFLRALVFPRP